MGRKKKRKTGKAAAFTIKTAKSVDQGYPEILKVIATEEANTSPESTKPSSASTVFGITELLERILSYTDMRTLLMGQRVSTKWQAVINSSPAIQKKLFRVPVKSFQEARRLGMVCDRSTVWSVRNFYLFGFPIWHTRVLVNPLLFDRPTAMLENVAWADLSQSMRKDLRPENLADKGHRPTWRSMLITQPPYDLYVDLYVHSAKVERGRHVGVRIVPNISILDRSFGSSMDDALTRMGKLDLDWSRLSFRFMTKSY